MLSEKLAKLRTEKNATLEEVGKYIGAEKQTVWGWENKKSKPNYDALVKLAKFYGVTTDYLLDITDEIVPQIINLAEIFSNPTSPQYINKIKEMLDSGYTQEQIGNFIEMTIKVSKEKSRQ